MDDATAKFIIKIGFGLILHRLDNRGLVRLPVRHKAAA
jgi:hypothetical protein